MSRQQAVMIERWLDLNSTQLRELYDRLPGVERSVWGMDFDGRQITESRTTVPLARMLRPRSEMYDVPPLLAMNLPNVLTIGRHRLITKVAKSKDVEVVAIPERVLESADIARRSIRVVATQKRPQMFRAPQQLITATVRPRWRTFERSAYFLSGFDLNEPGLSYFFCELPPGVEPTTIEEAYLALKPESVKVAEAQGRKVIRQGDMFFIPIERALQADIEEGKDANPYNKSPLRRIAFELHGSNHKVEHRARINGLTYARGNVYHRPLGRRPDHQPLHLGRHWHLVVKNTVPVTR